MNLLGLLKGIVRWTWRILEGVRRVLSLLLVVVFLLILLASLAPDELRQVPDSTALVLAPEGTLVDQLSGDALDRALARARGLPIQETLLKDLIDAVREGREDERVKVLVLELDGLGAAGLSKLQDIGDEILAFKESGKPVVAVASTFSRNQYYLAAYADEIFMHPMGYIYIDGYSRYLPYYRSAIDKLLVDFYVWRVGEYKSFVEPILRDDMSAEDREAASAYLEALWETYQSDVTAARGLAADTLQRYADNAVELMAEAGGDSGQAALNMDLVDELLPRDEITARIKALVGAEDDGDDEEDERSYPRIGHEDYLAAIRHGGPEADEDDTVAVLVASGTILDGEQPPGTIGGDSTSALIRQIAEDDDVRALVLRVDSGGGSAFASELILRELEVFQQSGRPLVVSMGSVAASGGYWISMSADEIWASPATLTGSIGVGATLPTVPRTLDALGIHVDGLGTTELAGQLDLTRPLGPDAANLLEQSVNYTYKRFITKVAEYRDRDVAAIDAVARGRVWIAPQAQSAELVDRLG
ncbi:MAG TPA: signal peptide peptidase SppA, partial [Gammaproteobacteria bacterium]|nr:signal peptide peptidase SppA [Gammaproteobacteria bacterium]